jgi:hypothetical protein
MLFRMKCYRPLAHLRFEVAGIALMAFEVEWDTERGRTTTAVAFASVPAPVSIHLSHSRLRQACGPSEPFSSLCRNISFNFIANASSAKSSSEHNAAMGANKTY